MKDEGQGIPMKDKFHAIIKKHTLVYTNDVHDAATECSDLCDQYAVEFAEWVYGNSYYRINKLWNRVGDISDWNEYTTAELLELFKPRI